MASTRAAKRTAASPFIDGVPVYSGFHRVLVARNPESGGDHDKVTAFAIEQNLCGRGKDVADALHDLFRTVFENLVFELQQPAAEYPADPDPELLKAYGGDAAEYEGGQILRRQRFKIIITRQEGPPARRRTSSLVPIVEAVAA